MSKQLRRRTQFVDRRIQSSLLMRVIIYWLASLFMVGTLTFVGWVYIYPGNAQMPGSQEFLGLAAPVLAMALASVALVLPIALLDLIQFSNRLAGPMVRLRQAMQQLGEGSQVEPLHVREGDFWQELADAFNVLQEKFPNEGNSDEANQLNGKADRGQKSGDRAILNRFLSALRPTKR